MGPEFFFILPEIGDIVFVALQSEIIVFAKNQLSVVNARDERFFRGTDMVEHQAIEHGLEGSFIAGGIFRIEYGGHGFEGGGIGSCFVVNDADAAFRLVDPVDKSADVYG